MKTTLIDRLNVVLIIISLILSFIIPFKLFLFTYAVLGPIHYLTEINWLQQKNFFVTERKWIWLLLFISILISIPVFSQLPIVSSYFNNHKTLGDINGIINSLSDVILLALLFFAIGLVYLKRWQHILLFFIFSLLLAKLVTKYILISYILVGIFLPTIIHVYLFTLLFMIMGTLHSKSKSGFIGIILLVLSPIIIFGSTINVDFYRITESAEAISIAKNFRFIQYILQTFDNLYNRQSVQFSSIGIKVQIFIAFCYTYHYLNWFSKTSVIGWHKNVSKPKFILILVLWIGIVLLFAYNYEIAYLTLFFLAILHVILEFPLNITSIKEIISKVSFSLKKAS